MHSDRALSGKGWKKTMLTALCHFLFSIEIGISGFGAGIFHLFMSELLWYEMLICYFSIKTRLHLPSYHGTTRSSPSVQACPAQGNKTNPTDLMGKCKRRRAVAAPIHKGHWHRAADGQESVECSRSSHGSWSTRSWVRVGESLGEGKLC